MKMTKKKSIKSISTPTFNRNQDSDGEDESLLGDQGRPEAKDLPTTRRMQNKIQRPTRQTGKGGPFRRQGENEQSHSRDVIRINGQYVVGTSGEEEEEEDSIGPK
jgi:hypothetical protein